MMQDNDRLYSGKTEQSPSRQNRSNQLMVPVISSQTSRWNDNGQLIGSLESMPLRLSNSKSPRDSSGKKLGKRPKIYDNGGYVKHPTRGPDVFGLKPRKQLESIVSEDPELRQISRSRSLRYSSLRSDDNSKVEHTKSVLEKAKTNRLFRENKRLYEQKVDKYVRD